MEIKKHNNGKETTKNVNETAKRLKEVKDRTGAFVRKYWPVIMCVLVIAVLAVSGIVIYNSIQKEYEKLEAQSVTGGEVWEPVLSSESEDIPVYTLSADTSELDEEQLDALKSAQTDLEDSLQSAQGASEKNKELIDALTVSYSYLESLVGGQNIDIYSLRSELANAKAVLEEAISTSTGETRSELEKQLSSVSKTISAIDAAYDERMDKFEKEMSVNSEALSGVKSDLESTGNSITEIKEGLTSKADTKDIEAFAAMLDKKAEQTALESTDKNVASNTREIENLKENMVKTGDLDTKANASDLTSLESRVGVTEEQLGALAVTFSDSLNAAYSAGYSQGETSGASTALANATYTGIYTGNSSASNYQISGDYDAFIVSCAGMNYDDVPEFSCSCSNSQATVTCLSSFVGQYTSNTQKRRITIWVITGAVNGDYIYTRSSNDAFMITGIVGVN